MLLLFFSFPMFAQKTHVNSSEKIKKLVVYDEKIVKGQSVKIKDSEMVYDEKGNAVEEYEYKNGRFSKHFKYQYDEQNNKIMETELDILGKVTKTAEIKYVNGLKTEKNIFDSKGKLKSRRIYLYQR
jgi:hypothetical protein